MFFDTLKNQLRNQLVFIMSIYSANLSLSFLYIRSTNQGSVEADSAS